MPSTISAVALLIVLTQIPTMLMWFQLRALKQDQVDNQNKTPVSELLVRLILSEKKEKQDLLNRLMSSDLHSYERMTVVTPNLSASTSSSYEQDPRVSMSDMAEYYRERGEVEPDERDLQNLSNDLLGLDQL